MKIDVVTLADGRRGVFLPLGPLDALIGGETLIEDRNELTELVTVTERIIRRKPISTVALEARER